MKVAKLKDKDKIIEVPVIPSTIIACPFQTTRIKGESELIDFFGKEKQFKVFIEYEENKGVIAEFLTIDEFINLFLAVRYVAEIKDGFIEKYELINDLSEEEERVYNLMLLEQQDYVNKIANIIRINPDIISDGKYTFLDRVHLLTGYLPDMEARKEILFERNIKTKVEKLLFHILRENKTIEWKKELQMKTQKKLEEWGRKNFLHAQMEVIKKELGMEKRVEGLKKKIKEKQDILPKEVKEKLDREIERLTAISESSPEAGNIEDYINFVLELPWNTYTEDNLDLNEIKEHLDKTHYGMEKAKERILEYLAVWKIKGPKSNVLTFIGSMGTGKTTLAQSIAKALGRKCIQISLGGVSDPHYLKGFRRTYIGSQPSVIMQRIHLAKSKNPVIILDEIDKVAKHSIHGSIEAALMEILDPAVNNEFRDHWVEVPFDLSNVLFILTGNYIENINPVLLDRLEVIELNGYTDIEKLYIAKDYIIPKERKEVGISELFDVRFEDEAIIKIIKEYTNEAGVRKLDEKIRTILRKALKDYFEKGIKKEIITKDDVKYYLQKPIYKYKLEGIGIVNGLAVSGTGGSILPIEVTLVPKEEEKQKIHISGNLKDVIKESVNIAIANVKRLYKDWPNDVDIYIHAIPGAVPKDGPSAGIAIATAVLSAVKQQKVKEDIAMTGELSLTGKVLPIGGLQEKITAAVREGIKNVLIPVGNKFDLADIDEETKSKINIKFVKSIEEVFEFCFEK